MSEACFRAYAESDRSACLAIFDANCPEFFAPNERDDYLGFLDSGSDGYEVCLLNDRVAGAFGVFAREEDSVSLNWILLDPDAQGVGIGSKIMTRAIEAAGSHDAKALAIAASHKSAPFFERFGAVAQEFTEHGWGPDMHRIDMSLPI